MSDWQYTLGLNTQPFTSAAQAAQQAGAAAMAGVSTAAQQATTAATAAATAATNAARQAAQSATAAAQQSAQATQQAMATTATATQAATAAVTQQAAAAAAATRQMGTAATAAATGVNSLGYRLSTAGQFVDDLQYGLRGVMNQIPMMARAFGAGAGVAGGIQIALVAAQALFTYIGREIGKLWDELSGENAYKALEKASEGMAEAHKRKLARLVGESGQKGDREAEGVGQVIDSDKASRARGQERLEEKKAAMAVDHELARVQAEGIKDVAERATALNELQKAQAKERLELERQFYAERISNLKNATGVTGNRHDDEKRLRQLQEEKRSLDLIPEDERNEKQRRRAAEIGGSIGAEKTRVDYARQAMDADAQALRRIEAETKLLDKKAKIGDLTTGRVVDAEKWKAHDDARAAANQKSNDRDEWQAKEDAKAAAEEERRARLQRQAEGLEARIADREDGGGGSARGGRGASAESPRRRIQGVVGRGSYQRDREGRAYAMRASRETRDPRVANRGREDAADKPDRTLEAMRKLLVEMKTELKKLNSPKK
jgi:trimeric autotransporter adhesin